MSSKMIKLCYNSDTNIYWVSRRWALLSTQQGTQMTAVKPIEFDRITHRSLKWGKVGRFDLLILKVLCRTPSHKKPLQLLRKPKHVIKFKGRARWYAQSSRTCRETPVCFITPKDYSVRKQDSGCLGRTIGGKMVGGGQGNSGAWQLCSLSWLRW